MTAHMLYVNFRTDTAALLVAEPNMSTDIDMILVKEGILFHRQEQDDV